MMDNENIGWVYVMSNEAMPHILKIGVTERTPEMRLKEANSSTWAPNTFRIELAKKVRNPKEKEFILHTLLTKYTERVSHKREFFRISLADIGVYFELMDGELWTQTLSVRVIENEKDNNTVDETDDEENDFVNNFTINF